MMQRRVLVTGANGFIGRWTVPVLLAAGYEVHAVTGPAAARSLPSQLSGARIHAVDLLDAAACGALIESIRATHLLHFAWIATPGVYWTSPDNERWLAASRHLFERFASSGGARVVSAGSCAEYDWTRAALCREDSSPLATSAGSDAAASVTVTAYARCKIALFESVEQLRTRYALSSATGRLFFLYGPDEPRERLVPAVITRLLAGREALCTHGRQVRSFLHVADVGAAFATLLDSDLQGAVNVGSDQRTTLAQLIERIAHLTGRPDLIRLGAQAAPPNEPAVLLPDVTRLYGELGWQPRIDLATGLSDTIEWWTRRASAGADE